MPPRRRGVGDLPAQLTGERRTPGRLPAGRLSSRTPNVQMHYMSELDSLAIEFTERSCGNEPFRFSVGPSPAGEQVVFYVFGDDFATSDRLAATAHLRTLLRQLREGKMMWW